MKIICFFKQDCQRCKILYDKVSEYSKIAECQLVDVSTLSGKATAMFYDIYSTPTVLLNTMYQEECSRWTDPPDASVIKKKISEYKILEKNGKI